MDEAAKVTKDSAYDGASFLSKWMFFWIIPLFNTGSKRTIDLEDLYLCSRDDDPKSNTELLER